MPLRRSRRRRRRRRGEESREGGRSGRSRGCVCPPQRSTSLLQ